MNKGASTSGSKPPSVSPGRGRPRKKNDKKEESLRRKDNYRSKYREQDLIKAIRAVKEGGLGVRVAAKKYSVPRTTLQDRLTKKSGDRVGRPTVLSVVEEELIAQRCQVLAMWGFPLGRRDLATLVQSYLNALGRNTRNVNIGSRYCKFINPPPPPPRYQVFNFEISFHCPFYVLYLPY